MKRNLLFFITLFFAGVVVAQENKFIVNGGYVFANIEDADTDASGWRLTGTYEFNPSGGMFSHGVTFGYLTSEADANSAGKDAHYKLNSWPVYYEPKVTLGKGKLKAVAKGALGTHITGYKRTGTIGELTSTDMGFYGGLGAGFRIDMSEKTFLNAEYEWVYMSNTSYRNGFVNSIMGGLGFRF